MDKILKCLEDDARLTAEQLAVMCQKEVSDVKDRIKQYAEVQSLYLMSGGYDLCVLIEGKTMKEVAFFVAQKLATIEDVISTSTHFVLRKYKDKGIVYSVPEVDERGNF